MTENPYKSTEVPCDAVKAGASLRDRARLSFRVATLVLLIPAVYNCWAFDAFAIASSRLPSDLANLYRTVNVLAFFVGGSLIWFLGVPLLEATARLVRIVFANGTDGTAWQETLHRSLCWTALVAIPGDVLMPGRYSFTISVYSQKTALVYHRIENAASIQIVDGGALAETNAIIANPITSILLGWETHSVKSTESMES